MTKKITFILLFISILNFNANATQYPVYHGGYNGGVDWVTCDVGDTIVFYAADPGFYDLYVFPAGTQVGANNAASYGDSLTMFIIQGSETSFGLSQVIPMGPNPPIINGWTINLTVNTPCLVTIPDATFKAYLVGNSAINTNGDTEIQCSEASVFNGTINIVQANIIDLTGLEAFTSLTDLQCATILVNSLDISSNTALTTLNCANLQLSTLDVSNNISLQYLYCSTNQLTSIDLSNNNQLKHFQCSDNLLTTIDLSNNLNLTWLDCSINLLTSINVSANSAINQVQCADNLLINLNVANGNNNNFSAFTSLNNPNLECIQVDNAAFSTANWTNIDAIASFSENCLAGLEEPLITELIVSPNPTLANISVITTFATNLEIKNINGMLIQQVPSNGAITIDLTNYASGVYFVRTSEGQTVKFIKE